MAMAHPNPGGGKRKVAQPYDPFRRVTSAPPDLIRLKQMIRPLDAKVVERIRQSARDSWNFEATQNKQSVTTYGGLHTYKNMDEPTQARVRPSSKHRLNKPHPPTVFLVTRAKKVDGCYEPEAAATEKYGGKAQLDLDNYVASHKDDLKRAMGGGRRPSTSYRENQERAKLQSLIGPAPAQAAEAWIKLSNAKDQTAIRKEFQKTEERIKNELEANKLPTTEDYLRKQNEEAKRERNFTYRPQFLNLRSSIPAKTDHIYSATRWLKRAGYSESECVKKLAETIKNAPPYFPPMEGPHFHITDYSSMFASAPKPPYQDFQIHPEWHMPWHKKYATLKA